MYCIAYIIVKCYFFILQMFLMDGGKHILTKPLLKKKKRATFYLNFKFSAIILLLTTSCFSSFFDVSKHGAYF